MLSPDTERSLRVQSPITPPSIFFKEKFFGASPDKKREKTGITVFLFTNLGITLQKCRKRKKFFFSV